MNLTAIVGLMMYIAGCAAAASAPQKLPTVERADTRDFIGYYYADTALARQVVTYIVNALPNETAVCLYGAAQDTSYMQARYFNRNDSILVQRKLAIIDSVSLARIDHSGPRYIQYQPIGTTMTACLDHERLIGLLHTHPDTGPFERCEFSDNDVLFAHRREAKYWFFVVMCPHQTAALWADGRRVRWAPNGTRLP